MTVVTKNKKPKAVHRLERSKLAPRSAQLEAMGDDIDIGQFRLYLASVFRVDISKNIISATISRTIEGASTLKVTVNDYNRSFLNSGLLNNRLDVSVDGLWFRLCKVEKSEDGDDIMLTFEDREIAVLRTYNKYKQAKRTMTTRAEFILNLIREPKEFGRKIPVVIPELHVAQPVVKSQDLFNFDEAKVTKEPGVPEKPVGTPTREEPAPSQNITAPKAQGQYWGDVNTTNLMVKTARITKEQIQNANAIISVGASMQMPRKVIVCAIMTAIQESTLINLSGGDDAHGGGKQDSAGLFQQYHAWGTYEQRTDPGTSSRLFYQRAIKAFNEDPKRPYWDLCYAVQRCKESLKTKYEDWRFQAEKIVTAYGFPGGDNMTSITSANMSREPYQVGPEYTYMRGKLRSGGARKEPEHSWECIQRLAEEVQWRAFFVSGTFYYISDDDLYRQKPSLVISEFSDGIEGLGGDLDIGKKSATVDIKARVGRWLCPPGSVVVLRGMGPWNGRWLVTDFERDLLGDNLAQVTLKKPRPTLPEPEENILDDGTFLQGSTTNSKRQDPAMFGGLENTNGSRQAIVEVAKAALNEERSNHYSYIQKRPFPDSLFSPVAHSPGIDCSAFAILCYKEAGVLDDPGAGNYGGSGNTNTIAGNPKGTWVFQPSPGDLVMYGTSRTNTTHVAVYIGDGEVIGIGSQKGILKLRMDYRSDIVGYRSFLPLP